MTYVVRAPLRHARSELERIADEGRVCVLELETEGALRVQENVDGSVTLFIAADVPELERRLRARATESSGEIGERIASRGASSSRPTSSATWCETTTSTAPPRLWRPSLNGNWHSQLPCPVHDPSPHRRAARHDNGGVDSRYALVIVAAKRARQINNYHHQLGEGMGFEEAPPPLVESRSKNYLTMSLEEIAQGKIKYEYRRSSAALRADAARHNVAVARILLGVTGGIAAYKACELLRLLVKGGHEVVPLVTPGAERFVTAETFNALARRPRGGRPLSAPDAGRPARVAPLTANTLAKLAHGLADNVLTEAALAHRGPLLVAPAMNTRMWEHPATQANLELLRARGVRARRPGGGRARRGRDRAGPDERARRRSRRAVEAALVAVRAVLARARLSSSRPAARASRSTPCGTSATARPGAWASRSRRRRSGAGQR